MGELGSLRVGIVTSNGVEDVNIVLEKLLGGYFKRSISLFDVSFGNTVINIGELEGCRVSDGFTVLDAC